VDQGLVEDTEQLSTGTYEVGLNVSDDKGRKINTSYVLTVNSVNDGGGNDGGGGSSGGGSSSFSGGMSILDSEPEKNLSIGLSSDVIAVGQSVTVSGTLGNAEGSENVTVTVDGEELGEVQVSEDGGYSMSFTPEDTGNKTVEAVSGDLSASAGLEVIPGSDLEISSVSSPEVVRLNDTFSVCTDIASGSEPEVELFENGVSVENRTGTDVCFRRTISEPGDYEYLVEASVSGQTVQNSFTVDVRELSTATVDSDSADSDEAGSSAGQRITGAFNNAVSGTSGKVGISILAGLILTVAIIFGL